jgi:hypothetical protein
MLRFAVVIVSVLGLGVGAGTVQAQFRLPMKLDELERRMHADSNDPAAHFNVALAYWNAKRWRTPTGRCAPLSRWIRGSRPRTSR